MSPPTRTNLRKVQPFLLPHPIAQALEATARSMASPMMPYVSLAAAARELVDKGLVALDALLRSQQVVEWAAVDPPRGARRREAAASSSDERVRDDTYVQVSPLALSEDLIARLEDVRRRLSATTGAKVSTVKVLRESLVRGLSARDEVHSGVAALMQKYAREFSGLGIATPAQLTVVASGVTQRYVPPPGQPNAWGAARARKPRRKATIAPPPDAKATTVRRPRPRGRHQQAAVRRETSGDDDESGGDGEPPPAAPPAAQATARRPSPVDPAWRAKAQAALARLLLAAVGRAQQASEVTVKPDRGER